MKIKENSFDYSKSYYLNIHFSSRFYITDIVTNHPQLKSFKKENIFPKTLYRILNSEKHKSLLNLYYRLKYTTPSKTQEIHLQLNSSNIIGRGNLKVLATGSKYCFKLKLQSIHNTKSLLDKYREIPPHKKIIAYQVYANLHQISFENPKQIAHIFEPYPYAQTTLYQVFNDIIGVKPSIVWRDRRLLSFMQHLLHTDEYVTKFYAEYGFSNASHLYKYFKKHLNTTPASFRKKYKDN